MSTSTDTSQLLGRSAEVERLQAWAKTGSRVLTLRGPGGAGKSLIAEEFAARHGAVIANLADCEDRSDIIHMVGVALGLPQRVQNFDGVRDGLKSAKFVVLDDADPVVAELAAFLGELLPDVSTRFLVTARQRLELKEESFADVGSLSREAALELLERRARSGDVDFSVDEAGREAIERLIELVDGLPLGIELVATRLQILAPDQLIERLERQFDVLSRRSSAVERHSAVDACIEWSWTLLSEADRQVLTQCSIFRSWFTMEDAEAVVQTDGWVGDALDALVETSLVRLDRESHRFMLYESVRRYLDRHTTFDSALATRFVDHLRVRFLGEPSTAADTWAALKSFDSLLKVAPVQAVRLVTDARQHLWRAGYLSRTVEMLERALEQDLAPIWEAKARAALASCYYSQTHVPQCDRELDEAERVLGDLGSDEARRIRSHIASMRALRADEVARQDEAARQYEIALESSDVLYPIHEVHLLASYGLSYLRHGFPEKGLPYLQRALHVARNRASDPALLARTLSWVGHVYLANDEVSRSIAALREALDLFAHADDLVSRCRAKYVLGLCYLDRDPAKALEMAESSLNDAQLGNLASYEAAAQVLRARILRDENSEGDIQRALMMFDRFPDRTDSWSLRLSLVVLYVEQRRLKEAQAELTEFLGSIPEDVEDEREWLGRYLVVIQLLIDGTVGDAAVEPAFVETAQRIFSGEELTEDIIDAFDNRHLRIRHDRAPLPLVLLHDQLTARQLVDTLTLLSGGDEVELPDGTVVEMRSRRLLKRLLLALCERHKTARGEHVTVDELIEEGWPDEQMTYESGLRRVYSAIRNLRKLGFEEIVINGEVGYLIDPEIELREK